MSTDAMQTPGGLSSAEAEQRFLEHGPNRPPAAPPRSLASRAWTQVRDPMILLLIGAGVLTTALSDVSDTVIIAAVVVFNTVVGLVQEVRADRAVAALADLAPLTATVRRDGATVEVPAERVVPGDEMVLVAGDVVAADAVVVTAHQLQLDESMMTGESVPVERATDDALEAGTLVTRGRAVARVTRTGADSGLGRLAAMIAATPLRATPLQRRLGELSRVLVVVVVALTAIVVALGLAQGRALGEMAIVGVSLAVAAVPESLPAVVAVSLALGASRMARRHAVVRNLPAVETLGSVTTVASDKTGTLTEGRMVAERLWTPAAEHSVTGRGYDATTGTVSPGPEPSAEEALHRLLRDVLLCNDAHLVGEGPDATVSGDPLEGALVVVAAKAGPRLAAAAGEWERVAEQAFDHETRRMTTTHRHADGRVLSVRKGAPEAVLADLAADSDGSRAAAAAERLAREGYRVIAVTESGSPASGPQRWELVGLVGIDDPPRDHIPGVVAACRRAGIQLVLVTGDHPETARAIATRVGILVPGEEDDGTTVLARVRPEQKVEVVRGLQDGGHVVAMLGDGVNDAPALRQADIGVAAGLGGTQVAREAADLVLLDDDLSTVVAAVEEGRRIFTNIRSFLLYAVSGGAAEVAVMLAGPLVGIAQPLLPAQILWINLLTHGLTGVAFGAEPADPAEMARPPRSATASVFTGRFVPHLAVAAALLTVTSLAVGMLATGEAEERTAVFLTLGLGQLAVAWGIRARGAARTSGGGWLGRALVGASALLGAAVVLPPLQGLLGTEVPLARVAGAAVLAAAVPGLVLAALRARERRAAG